jgi:DNA polymerase-3 subunit epsilon
MTLGPYRSGAAAQLVVEALWDAVPIRRCLTQGGRRSAACNFAQLGVSLCPCDGTVSEAEYEAVVARLRRGIEQDPALLLDPLAERMRHHARHRRFEEAATIRDRHRALGRSLEDRRVWQTLQRAGTLWLQDAAGESALIEGGRLIAAWVAPAPPPLIRLAPPEEEVREVPASAAEAEECRLIWNWIDRPDVRIVEVARPFGMPSRPVTRLESLAG